MTQSPRVLHVIPGTRQGIFAVTILGDEMFVVFDNTSTVNVYRASDFVELRKISIPGMHDSRCLVACPHNNCLYISKEDQKHIHRVDSF